MKGQGTPGSRVRKINDKRLRKRICYTGDFKKAGLRGFWKKKKKKKHEGKTLLNVARNEAVLSTIPGEIKRGRGYKISPWRGRGGCKHPVEVRDSRIEGLEVGFWRGRQIGFRLGDADIFRGVRDNREDLQNQLIGRHGMGRLPVRLVLSHSFFFFFNPSCPSSAGSRPIGAKKTNPPRFPGLTRPQGVPGV